MSPVSGQRPDPRGRMGTDLHLERLALRLLCVGTPQGPVKDAIAPLLRDYLWRRQLHQVIFSAIAGVASDDPAILQELLPARLTRMGFPDVEWEEFFAPHSLSREESIALVRRMLAGA
jgi:hypothetical protein